MSRFNFLFALLSTTLFATAADVLPVEAFGRLPQATQVALSPDGKKAAFIRNSEGFSVIGVYDIKDKTAKYLMSSDNISYKIEGFTWANNQTILVSANYPVTKDWTKYTESRLLQVNSDGGEAPKKVFVPKRHERTPQFQDTIIDILPEEPNHILMALDLHIANAPSVYKINLKSKLQRKLIYRGKADIYRWMTDRQHRLRLGFGRDGTKIFFRLLDLKTQQWRKIWQYELFENPDITPLGFGLDPNHLYIRANHQERYAIFKVNLAESTMPRELIYADENYDVEGALIYSNKTNDVIGVYHGEADNSKVFFDPAYLAFQTAINKALPNAYNNIASMSADEEIYVLFSSGPDAPGAYYIGNRKTKALEFALEQYPLLYQKALSGKTKVSYPARDGVNIEAYVTQPHPNTSQSRAGIILPHGGPMSRNYGGFDWFAEFFASRGYTLLEPNFRGSSGYGFNFEMASIQQWGGAMQDDLQDAARWLVQEYDVDKSKVCILGGSYGGYAALFAAAKQQETFRCALSFAGVSDLEYLVRKARRFNNYKVVKKQIGTRSDLLEERSPINFAAQINIPVMLIHGHKDRIVDVHHSREMYQELLQNNKVVEYIELENGNHYMEIEANRLQVLTSFDKFLSRHLNP